MQRAVCSVQCAVLGPRQDLIKVRVRRDCRWWPSERLVDSLPTAGWRAATVAVAGVECFGRLLGLLGLPCGVSAIVGCVLDEMLRERNCTVCVPCVYRVSCLCSPSDAAARSAPLRAQSTQSTRILSGGWKRRAERALHIHACARDEQSQCSANHGKSLNASTGRHRQTQADTGRHRQTQPNAHPYLYQTHVTRRLLCFGVLICAPARDWKPPLPSCSVVQSLLVLSRTRINISSCCRTGGNIVLVL